MIEDGKFIPKWKHEWELEKQQKKNEETYYLPREVIVTVDGHRYKVQ